MSRITSGISNLNLTDLNSRIIAVRNRIQTDGVIRASDVNEITDIYNLWVTHKHTYTYLNSGTGTTEQVLGRSQIIHPSESGMDITAAQMQSLVNVINAVRSHQHSYYEPVEVGITMSATGWGGYAREWSPYRDWHFVLAAINNPNSAYGNPAGAFGSGGGKRFHWYLNSIGGFDLRNLPRLVAGGVQSAQGVLTTGAIGPLPAGTYYMHWWYYNTKSAHCHVGIIQGVSGTKYAWWKTWNRGTTTFINGNISIPEPFYLWSEYSTNDGWANEYGTAGFTLKWIQ